MKWCVSKVEIVKIKFNPELAHQHDAINAVIDLFDGQQTKSSEFSFVEADGEKQQLGLFSSDQNLAFANTLTLSPQHLYQNTRDVQLRNGIEQTVNQDAVLPTNDFSIEMETGTGKTYVYLRTAFELN